MTRAEADSGEGINDPAESGRHTQQRLLEPDERACVTCVRLEALQ